jgi:hypothetical protein
MIILSLGKLTSHYFACSWFCALAEKYDILRLIKKLISKENNLRTKIRVLINLNPQEAKHFNVQNNKTKIAVLNTVSLSLKLAALNLFDLLVDIQF